MYRCIVICCFIYATANTPNITDTTPLSSTSFTVNWTITDPTHNYIITWTNLNTGVMYNVTVPENTSSYTVTGLNGIDNYNVSVTAIYSGGMIMSDTVTIYGKNVITILCTYIILMICMFDNVDVCMYSYS